MIRLALVAAALVAMLPVTGIAASTPSPAVLKAALAEPVDPGFVEAEMGTDGVLEGSFDAKGYADYWSASGISQAQHDSLVASLSRNHFVTGYGREWYLPRASDFIGELLMVFQTPSNAKAIEQSSKIRYTTDAGFQDFVETGIPDAIGMTTQSGGYSWTVVMFVKGNDLFAVARGSESDFMTSGALAQARQAYAVAPASIEVQGTAGPRAALSQYARLGLVLALIMLLAVATAIAIAVFVLRAPRPAPAPPRGLGMNP